MLARGAAILLTTLVACSDSQVLVADARFDEAVGGNRSGLATIGQETRPILRSHPLAVLAHSRGIEVPADGWLVLRPRLPAELEGAREVVVEGFVHVERAVENVEARLVRVSEDGRVPLRFKIRPRRASVELVITARRALVSGGKSTETRVVEIPEHARLALAFGIPKWPRNQAPVRFRLLVCETQCEDVLDEVIDPAGLSMRGWQDRSVDLARFSGRRVTLRFETEYVDAESSGFALPVWSVPTLYTSARRSRPDLVLISIDTLRADHLPTYGYARDTAPFVERSLARSGVVFERCISAATTTAPSHMTMFTSLRPSVHGVKEASGPGARRLAPGAATLAEVLRAHGYTSGAITENAAIALPHGFARGFHTYRENKTFRTQGHVERTLSDGLAWLEEHRDKQSFLFLHTYQVHTPYAPPPEYDSLFAGDGVEAHPDIPPDWHPDLYDREIRYTDDQLRGFFERAQRQGLLEDAIVVLTSDHGEGFLEHGFVGHGTDVHDEILRVPLVLTGPGIPPGRRVDAPVGLIDLMPTLLELVNVPAPPGLMGLSFASLVLGFGDAVPFRERTLYSEAWMTYGETARGALTVLQPTFAAQRGEHKLVHYRDGMGGRFVYYDLARDPREREDRYDPDDPEVAELREQLERYAEEMKTLSVALEREAESGGQLLPDPERTEKLRALGYLE